MIQNIEKTIDSVGKKRNDRSDKRYHPVISERKMRNKKIDEILMGLKRIRLI